MDLATLSLGFPLGGKVAVRRNGVGTIVAYCTYLGEWRVMVRTQDGIVAAALDDDGTLYRVGTIALRIGNEYTPPLMGKYTLVMGEINL